MTESTPVDGAVSGTGRVPRIVATSRGDFLVSESGPADAPTLVFVAGLGDDHLSWDAAIDVLNGTYRCVAFDNRGIGGSPVTEGPYSITQLAADAEELATTLGLGTVVGVGSSMGSTICQEWAIAKPGRHSALVLTGTWAKTDAWLDEAFEHWVGLATDERKDALLGALLVWCMSPRFMSANPDFAQEFMASEVPNLEGFKAAAAACQGHDATTRLGEVTIPCLVVSGAHDILIRPELNREVAALLPNSTLVSVDTGHMPFWEEPADFARLVDGWLRGL
jgi:pimeloyl-ACP methyl ester carboxylesterase